MQGVSESTHFAPHVRYEIGAFGWYHIDHLPATYDESKQVRNRSWVAVAFASAAAVSCKHWGACACEWLAEMSHWALAHCPSDRGILGLLAVVLQAFVNEQGGRHKFFNVWPYVRPLRAWIK